MTNLPQFENQVLNIKQNALKKNNILPSFLKDVHQRNHRSYNSSSILVQSQPSKGTVGGNNTLYTPTSENRSREYHTLWLKAIRDGFILIFATIAVYILICLAVFLFVRWLSKRSCQLNFVATSNMSENSVLMQTPATLMSHR